MKQLLERIKDAQDLHKRIFLVNLPEEINGAYMLPGVLSEALLMRGMTVENVRMVNHLDGTTIRAIASPYEIKMKDTLTWYLPPHTFLQHDRGSGLHHIKSTGMSTFSSGGQSEIWYWNGFEYQVLIFSDFF